MLISVCSVFSISQSKATTQNLIYNGSFEAGSNGNPYDVPFWTRTNTEKLNNASFAQDGNYTLSVPYDLLNFGAGSARQDFTPMIYTNSLTNRTLTLEVYQTHDWIGGQSPYIVITYYDSQDFHFLNHNDGYTSDGLWDNSWHEWSIVLSPNKILVSIELYITYETTNPIIKSFVDNVKLMSDVAGGGFNSLIFNFNVSPTPASQSLSPFNQSADEQLPQIINLWVNTSYTFNGNINHTQANITGTVTIATTNFYEYLEDGNLSLDSNYINRTSVNIVGGAFSFGFSNITAYDAPWASAWNYQLLFGYKAYRMYIDTNITIPHLTRQITFFIFYEETGSTSNGGGSSTQFDVYSLILPSFIYCIMIGLGLWITHFRFIGLLIGLNVGTLIYMFVPSASLFVLPFVVLIDIVLIIFRPKGE
jgi:hypothetical protein